MDENSKMAQRRNMGLSRAEIERQIDTRVPSRTAWPKLPALQLWSCLQGEPAKYVPNHSFHASQVRIMLGQRHIKAKSIILCHRIPYGSSAKDTDATTVTLHIVTQPNVNDITSLVCDIRRYLAENGDHIAIEVWDGRAANAHRFPILPSDYDVINSWYKGGLRDKILDVLDRARLGWVSLSVYRMGEDERRDRCPCCVVIGAVNPRNPSWDSSVMPKIRSLCPSNLNVNLIHQNYSSFVTNEGEDVVASRHLTQGQFRAVMHMGSSCGPDQEQSNGTLGGKVSLRQMDKDLGDFALTTHHAIMSQALANQEVTNDFKTLLPTNVLVTEERLLMKSPSDFDTNIFLGIQTARMKETKELLDCEAGNMVKGVKSFFQKNRSQRRETINDIKRELRDIEQTIFEVQHFHRKAGYVYASSGARVDKHTHRSLDWTLIRLQQGREMKNLERNARDIPEALDASNLNSWRKVDMPGRIVAKHGRSSRWTHGTVNAIESVFSGNLLPYGGRFTCWLIIPQGGNFAQPGDCGSIVLDSEPKASSRGSWVGILIASDVVTGIGFSTPIHAVFADIQRMTGTEVVEPKLFVDDQPHYHSDLSQKTASKHHHHI